MTMKTKLLILCLCVLTAASCSTLGKYKPETKVSDNIWGSQVAATDSASNIALLGWKEVFQDTCLQNLIDLALLRNLDLQAAMEHVRQAEAQLTGAKLAYVPTLCITPNFTAAFSGDGLSTIGYDYAIPATSTWQLSIFRLTNNLKSAKANVARSEDYYAAARTKLIASVANTYYTILMLDAQLKTSRGILIAWEKSVETVKALMDAGLADQVAVSQYTANYEDIKINIASLENQLNKTENAMCLLLSEEPDFVIARGDINGQTIPERIEPGVPVQMLALRPDVRAAQRDMELAHYATRGALLNFFPALSINGSFGLVDPGTGAISPMSLLGNVGASLTAPILNAGKNRSEYRSAQSRQRESRLIFDKTLLAAGSEVNDAYTQFRACQKMAASYSVRVAALDKARQDTEYLMTNSLDKTYLDVLYAYTGFFNAKLQLIANQALEYQSLVSIYTSLGGC